MIPAGPDNSTLLQREDIPFVNLVDSLQHRFTYADARRTFLVVSLQGRGAIKKILHKYKEINQSTHPLTSRKTYTLFSSSDTLLVKQDYSDVRINVALRSRNENEKTNFS